jgi:RNA polymerase-binding transcription factor DksA
VIGCAAGFTTSLTTLLNMANKPKKKSAKPAAKKKAAPKKPAAKTKAVKHSKPPAKKPAAKVAKQAAPAAKVVKAAAASTGKGKASAGAEQKNGRHGALPTVVPTPPPKPIRGISLDDLPAIPEGKRPPLPAVFLKKQKQRLLELRTHLLDAMEGVANESIRTRPEGGEASVGGMHMGDAGSDAYDRDFALSLLSKEQDALNEIQDALKRIDARSYGYCEMTGKRIHEERLEALPFTRFTREAQEQIERNQFAGGPRRVAPRSVFKLDDESETEEDEEGEDEAPTPPANEAAMDFSGQ